MKKRRVFVIVVITIFTLGFYYLTTKVFTFKTFIVQPSEWKHELVTKIFPTSEIKDCVREKTVGLSFFTPSAKIQKRLGDCFKGSKLRFQIDKIPPSTLKVVITPEPRPVFLFVTKDSSYGVVIKQNSTYIPFTMGKPYPEQIENMYSGLIVVYFDSYPEKVIYVEKIDLLINALLKLPELRDFKLSVIKNFKSPPTIKIETPGFAILLDADKDIESLEKDLNKALTVYEYLKKSNQSFEYIDTRFDRITVK